MHLCPGSHFSLVKFLIFATGWNSSWWEESDMKSCVFKYTPAQNTHFVHFSVVIQSFPSCRQIHSAPGDPAGEICCTADEDGRSLLARCELNVQKFAAKLFPLMWRGRFSLEAKAHKIYEHLVLHSRCSDKPLDVTGGLSCPNLTNSPLSCLVPLNCLHSPQIWIPVNKEPL